MNALGDFDIAADRLAFVDGESEYNFFTIFQNYSFRQYGLLIVSTFS